MKTNKKKALVNITIIIIIIVLTAFGTAQNKWLKLLAYNTSDDTTSIKTMELLLKNKKHLYNIDNICTLETAFSTIFYSWGPEMWFFRDHYERAINRASYNLSEEGVLLLLKNGANPNKGALSKVLTSEYYSESTYRIVKILIDNGAKIDDGNYLIDVASNNSFDEGLSESEQKIVTKIYKLIEKHADEKQPVCKGRTSLFYAVESGNIELVKYLCSSNNVNIDYLDLNGRNALFLDYDLIEVDDNVIAAIKVLLDAGINVNQKDDNRQTADEYAYDNGEKEVAALIKKYM